MFDHNNIVKLIGVSIANDACYMILEFMTKGNLHDYLANKAAPTEVEHRIAIGKSILIRVFLAIDLIIIITVSFIKFSYCSGSSIVL